MQVRDGTTLEPQADPAEQVLGLGPELVELTTGTAEALVQGWGQPLAQRGRSRVRPVVRCLEQVVQRDRMIDVVGTPRRAAQQCPGLIPAPVLIIATHGRPPRRNAGTGQAAYCSA